MLRTSPRLTLSIALLACTGAALAQTSAQSVPAVSQPTPQTTSQTTPRTTGQPPTERIETDTPATTVDPRRGTQIRENRNNRGEVTAVEVQSGPSRYSMKSGQPAGNAQPGDAQSSGIRAPQWQVMEFDLNGKRKAAADAEATAAAAAGTPATPTTATASATANATGKPVAGAMPTAVPAATTPMLRPAEIPPPPPLPATR